MRLCVDEDLASKEMLGRLRRAGHEIVPLTKGLPDVDVWNLAQRHDAPLMTMNASDFIGLASSTSARISGLAHPMEVLVSSTVKDLVAGSGIAFVDRGSHELKGVPGTWHVFAVA